MMISFAWTTDDFLAGRKTATRRFWTDEYAEKWWRNVQKRNNIADAYDKNPRFGGKKIGEIRVRQKPFRQPLGEMTGQDLKEEGTLWKSIEEFVEMMGGPDKIPFVIKFDKI